MNDTFEIKRFDFDSKLFDHFSNNIYVSDFWPLVYILSDGKVKEAYVGETADARKRMEAHLKNNKKNKLTAIHLITSDKFNKSATLDIESNLIKYLSGDGKYKLLNANLGLANHNYYQKQIIYWKIFEEIWNKLRAAGITVNSIDTIDNKDLFKYSPYKTLTPEQKDGLMIVMENLLDDKYDNMVVEGGSGTGKTVMATFLFKLICSDNQDFNFKEFGDDEARFIELVKDLKKKYPHPNMGLVVPMSSFRNTLKKVFSNVKGLKSNMVIGPADVAKKKYDILLVDESHRLRRRVNLGTYFGSFDKVCMKLGFDKNSCSELDWILKQSEKSILFYDGKQSIKPSDTRREDFKKLKSGQKTKVAKLKTQLRVRGGKQYVQFLNKLLNSQFDNTNSYYTSDNYELKLFHSISEMLEEIKTKNKQTGLSRLIAGYSWEWSSKKDKSKFDIEIEGVKLKWNTETNDWVNSANAINEVGCIHTTQGYDLNYAGVIFGKEISYNKKKKEIEIIPQNYYDKNGKNSIKDENELKDFILNIYNTIMLRGIKGTYVYVCDENLREYFSNHIHSEQGEEKSKLHEEKEVLIPYQNSIPLYDLNAAAGDFSKPQQVEDFEWVKIPDRYRPTEDLFACRVLGNSMNKVIPDGSICMFRKYSGGSRSGKIVLVQHADIQDPDFASGYTVKEYHSKKQYEGEIWQHESIILKPLSRDSGYKDIVLEEDTVSQLNVIGIFECVLE